MTKQLSIALLCSLLINASCNNSTAESTATTNDKSATETSATENTASVTTMNSMDIMNKTIDDNFFIGENTSKQFTITDVIATQTTLKDNIGAVGGVAYSPASKTFILEQGMAKEDRYTIHGQKIRYIDDERIDPTFRAYSMQFILSNPKDIQKLSFYKGSSWISISDYSFEDLLTVTGTLDSYKNYTLYFGNCTIKPQTAAIASNQPTQTASESVEVEAATTQENSDALTVNVDKAYFYNEPNEVTKRKAYLIKGQQVKTLQESNGFVMVEFTNDAQKTTKGWMAKTDLQ